jgi:hypothetical protein
MKRITLILAVLSTVLSRPAHADTLDFTWNSSTWVKSYENSTQFAVTGPFTLSGTSTVTFAELVTGGAAARTLTFGGHYGGTFTASGDGTYNGAITFPTTSGEPRSGLAVLTPTSDGFTVVVQRAASGPDAGAAFSGVASSVGVTTRALAVSPVSSAGAASTTASASEPGVLVGVAAAFAIAARVSRVAARRRSA